MRKVIMEASQIQLAEPQSNEIYMSVWMRMFSTRPNRNGYAVSEAFIDRIIANSERYTCLPLCADANRLRHGETQGQTHMLEGDEFRSEQIGSFFCFAKATSEFGISLLGEARIPKRNAKLCETLQEMYKAGSLNFSFEIMVSELEEENGVCVITDAASNELIGMAVVTTPAYPEAKALTMVAEDNKTNNGEDDHKVDEKEKKIAELEAQLKLAEQKSENDEELRRKDEQLEEARQKCEKAEDDQAASKEELAQKDTRIAELEAQVKELEPYKAEAEQLKEEKAAAELAAKQEELTRFAEAQGLDVKAENIASAIEKADYAALVAEAVKRGKHDVKPTVASYAMGGMTAKGEYDDLLGKA